MDFFLAKAAAHFETKPLAVSLADPHQQDCPLVYVNRQFEELTGYDRDEVLGRNCRFLQGSATCSETVAKLRTATNLKMHTYAVLANYRKSGELFHNFLVLHPLQVAPGRILMFGCQFEFKLHSYKHVFDEHLRQTEKNVESFTGLKLQTLQIIENSFHIRSKVAFDALRRYGWTERSLM